MNYTRRTLLSGLAAGAALWHMPAMAAQPSLHLWGPAAIPSLPLAMLAQDTTGAAPAVTFDLFKGPDRLRAGMASGTMPFLMAPTYMAANFYNRGKALQLTDILTNGFLYVVSRDKGLTHIEALRGKRIAIYQKRNTFPDLVLRILLAELGLVGKVDVVNLSSPVEAVALTLAGKIDTCLISEPQASLMLAKAAAQPSPLHVVMNMQAEWGRILKTDPVIPMVGLVQTADAGIDDATRDAFRARLRAAVARANAHPQDAARYGRFLWPKMPEKIVAGAVGRANLCAVDASVARASLEHLFTRLMDFNPKLIGQRLPDAGFYGR